MRSLTMGLALVLVAGCGSSKKEETNSFVLVQGKNGPADGLKPSKVAAFRFGDLWHRDEPKVEVAALASLMLARLHFARHEQACLAAHLAGSCAVLPVGPLLVESIAAVHPPTADEIKKSPNLSVNLLPHTLPLLEISFDRPDHSHIQRTLLKSSQPAAKLPARIEGFARHVEQEIGSAGATMIVREMISEPRQGYRIRYKTVNRLGTITIAAARPGETTASLRKELSPTVPANSLSILQVGSEEGHPIVIVELEDSPAATNEPGITP
jgi:hypothetical protein